MRKELVKSIKEKEVQLEKLASYIDKSLICAELYNKVVIEKAILKKELDEINKNKLMGKVVKLFPRKTKLICDYFNN